MLWFLVSDRHPGSFWGVGRSLSPTEAAAGGRPTGPVAALLAGADQAAGTLLAAPLLQADRLPADRTWHSISVGHWGAARTLRASPSCRQDDVRRLPWPVAPVGGPALGQAGEGALAVSSLCTVALTAEMTLL